MRTPIIPPPVPPAGSDPRALRSWFDRLTASVQSCVDALRNLEIPARSPIMAQSGGGYYEQKWDTTGHKLQYRTASDGAWSDVTDGDGVPHSGL
jgi:hypothetical protein